MSHFDNISQRLSILYWLLFQFPCFWGVISEFRVSCHGKLALRRLFFARGRCSAFSFSNNYFLFCFPLCKKNPVFVSMCNFFCLFGLHMPAMAALPQRHHAWSPCECYCDLCVTVNVPGKTYSTTIANPYK